MPRSATSSSRPPDPRARTAPAPGPALPACPPGLSAGSGPPLPALPSPLPAPPAPRYRSDAPPGRGWRPQRGRRGAEAGRRNVLRTSCSHPGKHRKQGNARLGDQTSLAGIDVHSARASTRSASVVRFGLFGTGSPERGLRRRDPLGSSTPSAASQWVAAFLRRLHELNWIENRNVAIEYRWAEGRSERYAEIAAEFVRLKVDVIVAHSTPAVIAAKQATAVIPIVFPVAGDPLGSGLVASLARPGGNVTGLSTQTNDLPGKRLELLREVVPGLRRLAIMANVGNPLAVLELREVLTTARTLGLEVVTSEIRRAEDIGPPSKGSRAARMHFLSWQTRSYPPIRFASTPWRRPRDCRRCTAPGGRSKREV